MVNFYAYSLCEYNTDCRRFQSGGSPWQMKCFIGAVEIRWGFIFQNP